MAFDVEGALKEGYTQEQIDAYIQQNNITVKPIEVTPEPIEEVTEEVTEEVITTPTPQPSPEPIQKTFDVEGALREGYTQEQIDTYLKRKKTFDVEGALKEGYTQEQIDNYLQGNTFQQTQQQRNLENESDGLRGFDQYGNQLGGLYGAGKILLGKLFDSDDMIVSGLGYMNRSDEAVQARGVKDTDTFVNAWDKGVYEVITDWLPYNLGQAVGIGLETIAVALVGAIAGSAIGPGGTVGGLLGGLVAKKIVKKTIIDKAKKIAKEEGKDAAKEFVAKEVTKALADPKKNAILRNEVNKAVGKNVALTGMAAKFGAGETVGRAVDEAIKDTENPAEQLAIIKELSTGRLASLSAAHAAADFIGARILLKPLQALAKPTQEFLLRFAKKFMMAAPGEAITEVIQSFIERYAAKLPLADKEAIIEYVNASAAGFVMPAPTSFLGSIRDYQPSKIKEDKKDDLDPELEPEVDDNKDPRQQAINNILNDEKNIIKAEEEEKSAKKIGRTKITTIDEEMLKDLGINPKTNAGKELLGKDLTDLDNMEMIEKILDNENLQVKRNQKAVDNFKRKIKRDRKKLLKAQKEAQDEKQPTPKRQRTGASDKVPNKSKSVITTGINTSDTRSMDTDKSGAGRTIDTTGAVDNTLEIEKKNPLVKGKKGNKAKVARINNGKVEVLEGVLEEGSSGLELIGKGRNNTKITTPLNEQQILNPTKKDLEKLEVKAKQAKPASTPEVKPKIKPKPKKKLLGDTLNEATEEELNAEGYESFIELDKDGNEKKRYRNIKTKKPLFAKEPTDTEKKLTEVRKQKQLAIERAENQRNQDGKVSPAYRKPIMQLQQMEDELLKQDAQEKKQSTPEQQELFAKDETISDTGETKQSVMSSFISEFGKNVNLGVKRGLLNIVDTVADLPNIIPNVDILPANVKAIYFDGKAYFIADRITKEDAPRMLLHEIGAHYGLVGMLGKANYDRIVKSLRSKKTSDTEIEAAFIYVKDSYPELAESSDDFIQEVIANIAEDAPNNTVYRRIVGYIKNFLSKLGMGWNVDNITAAQIQDMVQHSVRVSLAQPDITSSTRTALASKDLETAGNVFYSPLEKAINKQKIESMSVQEWKNYLSKRARKEGFVNQLDVTGILDWMNMLQRRREALIANLPNAPIDLDGFELDDRGRLSKDDILSWLGQYDVLVVDVIPEGAMSESEIENIREEETARLTEEIMSSGRYEDMYAEIEEQAGFIDETIPGVYRVFGSEHRQTNPEFNEEPYAIFIDESLIGSENFNLAPIDVIASETNEGVIIDDNKPTLAYLKMAQDKGFDVRIVKQENNYTAEDSARDYLYETHNPEIEDIRGQLQDEVDNEVAQRVDELINEVTYERDEGTYRDMQRTRDDVGVPEEYFEIVLSLDNKGGIQSNIYTSPHFEAIKNVILSIRADIRYDQSGNKVLFVEELQSDWAESLRKNKTSSNRKTKYGDLAYVEDTQLWTKLAIKRVIRLAAENDVDKVAFLNPMQAVSVHNRTDLAAEEYYGKILPSVLRKTLNSLENTSRQKNEIIRFKPIYKVDDTTLDLLNEIYELHVGDGSKAIREFDNIDYTPANPESFIKFQKTNELVSKLNEMYDSLDSFRDIYDFTTRVILTKISQDYNDAATDTNLLNPETRKATFERLALEFSPMDATVKKREFLTKQIDKLDAQIREVFDRVDESVDANVSSDDRSRLLKSSNNQAMLLDKQKAFIEERSNLPSVDYNRYNMLNLVVKQKKLTIPDMTNEQEGFTMTPKLRKVAQAGMPLFAKQGSKTRKQLKQEIEDAKTNKEKLNDKRKKAGQKTDDPADPFYNSNEWKKPMSKIRGFQNAVFGYDIGLYNKLRDEITRISKTKSVKEAQKFIEDTLARISIAQAVHAETLAGAFKELGNIIFDPTIEKFEIIRDAYNLRSIENMVRKFAKKNFKKGITLSKDNIADAEKFISQAITALQFKRIIENNKVLEAQARLLVRQGKKAEAEKVMQGYVYVDQTEAQLDKMIERFDDYPEIKEIQQSWIGVKNNVLQFLLDTEVIDQEQFDEYTLVGGVTKDSLDKLREDVFVPLYREGQPNIPRSVRKGTSSGRGIFVPRKGSIEPVDNVFLNMDIFVQAGITKGIANKTALQKIRTALEVQVEEDLIVRPTEERTKGFEDNAVEVSEIGPDGKQRKQLYEYSNIMYAKATNGAAKAMELGQGFAETIGRNTATVLRDFVVLNPVFGLAQTFVQDMNSAIFASNLRYGAIMIPLRVLYEFPATILNISSTHKTLKRYAAAGGYAFKQNDNNIDADINAPGFYNAVIRRLSRIPGTNIPTGITQEGALRLGDTRLSIGGLLNRIAMASDNSVRQAVYKQALMENKSHQRALETAFEIINFRKSGDHGLITFGRQYIPFFGAALQALSVQGKILQGLVKPNSGVTASTLKEARLNYLVAWSSVAGMTLMYNILMDDEEDKIIEQFSDQPVSEELKRYLRKMRRNFNQLDNKIRDRKFIIGDDGFHLTLRPDFNTYVAKVIPEQVYQTIIAENQDAAKFWTSIKRNAREIITLNLIPQAIRPMVDVYYNEDSRSGRPIIPTRMENLPPELQVLPTSTEASKKIGAIINTSPIIVDYYLRQYFGYAGGLATMLTESYFLEADTNPYRKNKPAKTTRDQIASFPGMTNFYSKDRDNRFMANFYELKNRVSQVTAVFNVLNKSPNPDDLTKAQDFLNEGNNQKLYDASKQINTIQEKLSIIRKARQNIYDQPATALYDGRLMTDEFKRLLLKDLEQQEVDALHTIHDLRVSIYGTNPFYNIETGEFFPGFDMTDLFEKGN